MCNRIRGTGFDAVPAEDAAAVIDVINGCVPLTAADTRLLGVLGRFDIDAIRGAGCGTEESCDAFLQTVLVALQNVDAPVPLLEAWRSIGVILRQGRLHHFTERHAHTLSDGRCRTDDLVDLRHRVLSLD